MSIHDIFPKHTETHHDLSVTNTAENLPRDAGAWLVGGDVYNPHASDVAYLQIFEVAAGSVTLGTTAPVYAVAVPAGAHVPIAPPRPILCGTRLSYAVTATRTGNGAPPAACDLTIIYA